MTGQKAHTVVRGPERLTELGRRIFADLEPRFLDAGQNRTCGILGDRVVQRRAFLKEQVKACFDSNAWGFCIRLAMHAKRINGFNDIFNLDIAEQRYLFTKNMPTRLQ